MILLLILAVVSIAALLNKRAVWLAAALCAGWGASFIMERQALYDWICYVDAAIFWALMFLPAEVSCLRRTFVILLQATVLCAHVVFWWCWGHGDYYGSAYFWALYATYLIMVGALALENPNVRSAVGAVLQGAWRVLDRAAGRGLAHPSPVSKRQEEGR